MFRMFLVFAYLLIAEVAGDCPYKECSCSNDTISCQDLGLKAIPTLVSTSTAGLTTLMLAVNSITSIPAGSLPANLVSLSFAVNPITTIDDTAFYGSATTLKSLAFSNANFVRIPDAMLHLNTLTSFFLSDTTIQDWNVDVMNHMGLTLTSLYLDNVGLKTWPGWLQNCSHLTELIVSGSSISVIPDGALDIVTNSLTSLTLDTNKLTTVPKAVSSLTSLQILSMLDNTVSDTAWLPTSTKLSTLTLGRNKISDAKQLSDALQHYADSLTVLTLDNNLLTQIPDLNFLANVQTFDFSQNRISDTKSGSLHPALIDIDLGYNLLPSIPDVMSTLRAITDFELPYNAITDLSGVNYPPSATYVDFKHNLIADLTVASFPEKSFIEILNLNYNPIAQIATDAFKNLPQLRELDLVSTKLSRLPLALTSLTSLVLLDLTGSAHLVCTCIERNLGPWAKTIYPGDIRGDCGHTSAYNFLVNLSPDCPSENHITLN